MPELGPHCPNPVHSSLYRVPMMRAYVRVTSPGQVARSWTPIGWFCRFCNQLEADGFKASTFIERMLDYLAPASDDK
jgi:hypothetical protein